MGAQSWHRKSGLRLEGKEASLLALVGTLTCWLLADNIQDWCPWHSIVYACSRINACYAAPCASFDMVWYILVTTH